MLNTHKIQEMAERFRCPDQVKAAVLDPENCNPNPPYKTKPLMWGDLSLAAGFPGVLLLIQALHQMDPAAKWDDTAHLYVLKIRDAIEKEKWPPCSLHGGIAGVCFALLQVSQQRTRYQRLLEKLEDYLIRNVVESYFLPLRYNLDHGLPSPYFTYDLISGIVGIGLYALLCLDQERFVLFSEEIVQLLIRLVQPIKVDGRFVPGWYLPSEMQGTDEEKQEYPKGNFNLGLAHGVPGILGLLALALERSVSMPGQKEAMETIAYWLLEKQLISERGISWPARVSWEEEVLGVARESHCRDAWCYGAPGVARAMYLAGSALKNEQMKKNALLAAQSIFDRPPNEWGVYSPTICHGVGGLLLIAHLMGKETQDAKLQKQAKDLEKRVWDFYQPEAPFGFPDLNPQKGGGFAFLNKAGLLEGADGVLLTLLTVSGHRSSWHYPFLVSSCKSAASYF